MVCYKTWENNTESEDLSGLTKRIFYGIMGMWKMERGT